MFAASIDATGNGDLGGDWLLEAAAGTINSSSFAITECDGLLSNAIDGTDGNDRLTSTAADDVMTGKKGDDTYVFKNGFGSDEVFENLNEGRTRSTSVALAET